MGLRRPPPVTRGRCLGPPPRAPQLRAEAVVSRRPLPLEIAHESPPRRGRHAPQLPRGQSERKESRAAPPPPGAAAESLRVAAETAQTTRSDVSLRRLQIPPPSGGTTRRAGGGGGAGERLGWRPLRPGRTWPASCTERQIVFSVLTRGTVDLGTLKPQRYPVSPHPRHWFSFPKMRRGDASGTRDFRD